MRDIKSDRIKTIQEAYCKYCILDTDCQKKLDKRYCFLANAITNNDENIYYCPHYSQFKIKEINNLKPNSYKAYNELTSEIEYLYHQGINRIKDYNKIINELSFFGYEILDFNLFLRNKTTYFKINISNNKKIIPELISNICQRKLHEQISIKCIDKKDYSEVYIYKKPKVKIEYSHQILAKNNNVISGDNYYIKKEYNDSYLFALSDGMGNGHKAYYESAKTLDLIKRLLSYNFSFQTTLKLLENFYDLKCEYDSYATLDILYINTANMKLNLYKMGSTTTYIIHSGQIQAYENKALPFKLDDINSSYELEYFKDDVILLLSDGISDFISIKELNEIDYSNSTDYILSTIINKIKQKENNELKDDASLIVIKIN
ncbi:MAG: SpoIIE family protein phosphatase [Anaeroplasma sp.]